jgi:hypothetical protein
MNSSGSDEFAHCRTQTAPSISICLSCYLTVSYAPSESELVIGQRAHDCTELVGCTNGNTEKTFCRVSNMAVSQRRVNIDAMLGEVWIHD